MDIEIFQFENKVRNYYKKKPEDDTIHEYHLILIIYLDVLWDFEQIFQGRDQRKIREARKKLEEMKNIVHDILEFEIIPLLKEGEHFVKTLNLFYSKIFTFAYNRFENRNADFYAYLITVVRFINEIYSNGTKNEKRILRAQLNDFKERIVKDAPYLNQTANYLVLSNEQQLNYIYNTIITGLEVPIEYRQFLNQMMVDDEYVEVFGFGGELKHLNEILFALNPRYR